MKRALVTGGSGVLGAAICRQLGEDGCHVIAHGNANPERAEAVAAEIRGAGGSAESVAFDVTDTGAAQQALTTILEGGAIQIAVSNAGIYDDAPLAGMSADQWRRVIDVSLHGFYNVVKPLLLPMMRTRWGRIVAVSSVSGVMGNRGQANYAAAKAGVAALTTTWASELARYQIRSAAIAPGVFETEMVASLKPEAHERITSAVPLNRTGSVEELAHAVKFIIENDYYSGRILELDVGLRL